MTQLPDAIPRISLNPSELSDQLEDNVRRFWEIQDQFVDCMDAFAQGWFERRHAGTHAALEASARMCRAQTPINFVLECQQWTTGAAHRMVADVVACHEQFITAIAAVSRPPAPPTSKEQSELLRSHRSKAA